MIRAKTFDQRRNFEFISKDQVRHLDPAGGGAVRLRRRILGNVLALHPIKY